jgi:hypothetical protein
MKRKAIYEPAAFFAAALFLLPAIILFTSAISLPGDNGAAMVRSIYKRMNATSSEDATAHFNYTVKTVLSESSGAPADGKVSTTTADIVISKKQARYTSKEVVFYQDEVNAFTVIPSRKTIYWGDSNLSMGKKERQDRLGMLQDTLFTMCSVAENKPVSGKEEYDRCITLVPTKKAQELFGMKKLVFYVSEKKEKIYKISVDYPEGGQVEKMEITYNTMELDYKAPGMGKPVKSLFIEGRNQLVPSYKGYTLVDNRKKK